MPINTLESARPIEHSRSSSKEHSENIICIELVFSELLAVSLLKTLLSSMFIIDLSLFRVAKASEGSAYLLESISCIRGSIFVWMKLECKFLVCFLHIFISSSFC